MTLESAQNRCAMRHVHPLSFAARGTSSLAAALSFLWLSGCPSLWAQSGCPDKTPYALLRQDEDYSALRQRACRHGFWDSLKFIPLNRDDNAYLTLGGEMREWYEGFHNASWGLGTQDGNGYLLQRLSVLSDWHVDHRVRFFMQLTSDIEVGRNGGPRPLDEARLWIEQAFADVDLVKSGDGSLSVRIGRQEFEFGSGRLVDAREGPNVRLAFDGADLILRTHSLRVDAFAVRPVVNNPNVMDAPPDHGTTFWGAYAVRPLPVTRGGNIDVYYLGIDKKQALFQRGVSQEVRHTSGGRFWGTRGKVGYNEEAMFQWGSFGKAAIRAWALASDADYKLPLPLNPALGVRAAATSGDRNPVNGAFGTFNPLFPTGLYFGEGAVNLNGPSNMLRLGPSLRFHLTDHLIVAADWDCFWRESLQDGVYGLGVNLIFTGFENQTRYIGSQPSVGAYWQMTRHFGVSAAYTHFAAGSFLRHRPSPGRDVDYAAIWTGFKF